MNEVFEEVTSVLCPIREDISSTTNICEAFELANVLCTIGKCNFTGNEGVIGPSSVEFNNIVIESGWY